MTPAKSPPRLLTLILLTAFSTLTLTLFLPSLPSMAADFGVSYATVSLAVGGYLAVTAVIQFFIGPLSDRIGRRPVLLACLTVFATASLICALANNFWVFLIFRLLQGGVIAGYALSLAILRDTRPERAAAGLIGYVSMAMAIGPMLGPLIGGLLDTAFGWRANFVLYAAAGFALLLLTWVDLGETRPKIRATAKPARASDLLRAPLFWAYAACTAFSTGAFYIFLTGAPLVAQAQFGVSTAELGGFIGSITAGFLCGGFFSARLAPRAEPITIMLAGRLIACFGLITGIALVLAGLVSPLLFFGATALVGLGNGITMPSSNAAALSVRPELAGSAAGWSGAMVVGGGAVLTTLTGAALPAEAPALMLLLLMLAATTAGLGAVIIARRLTRRADLARL